MLSIDKGKIMMEHYQEVLSVSNTSISIRCDGYQVIVSGKQLKILALASSEIYMAGILENIQFLYEH